MNTEIEQLKAERDFLLLRVGHAGSATFGDERWTGMSSNALVTVAFGGEDDCLPSDADDLAACYRTVMRLPRHLLTDAVFAQLAKGEDEVAHRYPDHVGHAREAAEWPGAARVKDPDA